MIIAIGSDHGGYVLKNSLVTLMKELGHEVTDVGCFSDQSVDYPDFAVKVANKVIQKEADCGVLVCGTGIGMSIAANRHEEIRAAVCHNEYTARMSREHNNANILCIGQRVLVEDDAKDITKVWLETEFDAGGRHQRRIEKFSK